MQAFPYIRWSSDKQASGSTLRRQKKLVYDFVDALKWPVERELRDEGLSGWSGANVHEGNLGKFLVECEREGGHGRALVVEQIDRLSRLTTIDVIILVNRLVETGLTVVLADEGMIIDKVTIRNQTHQLETIVRRAAKANGESEDKSSRVRAAWEDMRAEGRPVHCAKRKSDGKGTCPAWLEMDEDRTRFLMPSESSALVLHRIALINEIFDLYIGGMGLRAIARLLNKRGEPTWRGGKGWMGTTIKAIVHNRAVIGEYQHHVQRQPMGDPVPDYFPAVVSNEKFMLANEAGHRRIMASHSPEKKLICLLSNVAVCAECGGRMTFRNKARKANGDPVAYLQCDRYSRGLDCTSKRMVPYYPLERQVLDTLLTKALDDQHFQRDDEVALVRHKMADQRRKIDDIETRLSNLRANMEIIRDDPSLIVRYQTARTDLNTQSKVMAELDEQLMKARGKASRSEHIRRVTEIRRDLRGADHGRADEAARLIKLALNDLIVKLRVSMHERASTAQLVGPLGFVTFYEDGRTSFYDLLKRGENHSTLGEAERKIVEAYERRIA